MTTAHDFRTKGEQMIAQSFTLFARVCNHCGCVYIPAKAIAGELCPNLSFHQHNRDDFSGIELVLSEAPTNWKGFAKVVKTDVSK